MKFIELEQNTPEWLSFRRSGIGASDAPSIMGVGFKSAYQLYMDKMTGKETPVNAAMQRGKNLEAPARDRFISMTGININPAVVVHDEYDWQFASLDGIDSNNSVLVEIKCPGPKDHATAVDGMIPGKYYPQLQHQFCVTGLERGYYFSFDGEKGVIVEIQRDDNYIEKLLEKEKEFYDRMISFDPPKLIKNDITVMNDPEWEDLCEAYREIRNNIKECEAKEAAIKKRLIDIAAERNVEGSGIKLMKVLKKGVIDYSSIPELKGVNLEQYRKKTTDYWRLTLDEGN